GHPGRRLLVQVREKVPAAPVRGEQRGQVGAGLPQPRDQLPDRAQGLLVEFRLRHHQREEPGLGFVPGPQHRRGHARFFRLRSAGPGIATGHCTSYAVVFTIMNDSSSMRLITVPRVPRMSRIGMTKIAVVALGGNALTRAGQAGTYDEMVANAAAMATAVNDVLEAGWRVVIVHGNGAQGGNLAPQQEAALQQGATLRQEATAAVPAQPLALLGAMTQGMLGSLIARSVDLLRGRGTAAALVTHVTVEPADPAFGAPS